MTWRKGIPVLLCLLFFSGPAIAVLKADSLKRLLPQASGNPERLSELYARLAFAYAENTPDTAIKYAGLGIRYARPSIYKQGLAACYMVLGDIALRNDRLPQASAYLESAARFINAETWPVVSLNVWNDLGCLNDVRSNYGEAVKFYYKALDIAEQTDNKKWRANLYNNISMVYNLTGYQQKSLDLCRKAGAIFLEISDSNYYANSLVNRGYIFSETNRRDSAEFFFRKSLPLQLTLKNYYGLASLYIGLGILRRQDGQYMEALNYLDLALEMVAKLGPEYWGTRSDIINEVHLHQGLVALAVSRYDQSLQILRQVRYESGRMELLSVETKALKGLCDAFARMKRFDSAYLYADLFRRYNDSLTVRENKQQVAISEYMFLTELEKSATAPDTNPSMQPIIAGCLSFRHVLRDPCCSLLS